MSPTLAATRQAFVAAIQRDTPGTDLPRLVAVLDALIAWSVARPQLLSFRPSEGKTEQVGFERVGTKVVFWSAQVSRGTGPRLEIYPPTGRALSPADRTMVMETLNAHSREALAEGDRLRIGFGALKNATAQAAVLALMDRLLTDQGAGAQGAGTQAAGAANAS